MGGREGRGDRRSRHGASQGRARQREAGIVYSPLPARKRGQESRRARRRPCRCSRSRPTRCDGRPAASKARTAPAGGGDRALRRRADGLVRWTVRSGKPHRRRATLPRVPTPARQGARARAQSSPAVEAERGGGACPCLRSSTPGRWFGSFRLRAKRFGGPAGALAKAGGCSVARTGAHSSEKADGMHAVEAGHDDGPAALSWPDACLLSKRSRPKT